MKYTSFLQKIGFTQDESLIYKSLLKLGPASASDIVRETKLHRPAVYKSLPLLLEKGLVSMVPKGKYHVYAAQSPKKILGIITSLQQEATEELTSMQEQYDTQGKKPVITYAEGRQAITAAFSDVVHSLKRGEMYYRYSSNKSLDRENFVPKDYRQIRDQKGLERLVITNVPSKNHHTNKLGRIIKAVPPDFDLFEYDITQIIYGDKVSIIDYNTGTAITIQNKVLAEFQKKIFKLLFGKL